MESTRERALNGLIELWADVYSIETYSIKERQFTACQLKPYVKAALAEPDSSIHRIIESDANKADACIKYGLVPARVHHNRIVQNLIRKELRDNEFLHFFDGAFYLAAVLYIRFGIMFPEAERRMRQSFERALSHISLRHLLNKPSRNDIPHWFTLHPLLSISSLSAGSIAGANVHLRRVLEQRFKTFSGDTCYYEQDLKAALWECWNGNNLYEYVKMLSKRGDITQQMATHWRIIGGQEPELLRSILLRMLRKAIEELPDIVDIIKDRRKQEDYLQKLKRMQKQDEPLGSVFIRDEAMLENIEAKPDELREKLSPDEIIELLRKEGINKNDLTEKMWRFIFRLNDAFYEGAEIGSKKGLSLHAYFGDSSATTRKQLSRLRDRVNRPRAKQPRA